MNEAEAQDPIARALAIVFECHKQQSPTGDVWARFIAPRLDDPAFSAAELEAELCAEEPESFALGGMAVAGAYAVEAMRAAGAGDRDAAWARIADANLHLGAARLGTHFEAAASCSLTPSELGRRGGLRKHRETRAMEADTRAWCEQHLGEYDSLEDLAAAVVAARINPMPKATTRRWITEFAKDWRAAGLWVH